MAKSAVIGSRDMREGFPFLIWGSAMTALLVIVLAVVAFYFIQIQRHGVDAQFRANHVLSLTDSIARKIDQPEVKVKPIKDSDQLPAATGMLQNLRNLIPPNDTRLPVILRIDRLVRTGITGGNHDNNNTIPADLINIKRTTLQLVESEKSKAEMTRERLQATMIILTCLILIVISFFTGIILGELKNRFKAYRQERELNRLKSHFISLASHEFRTPLSSVKLSVSLIEKYTEKTDRENILKQCKKIHSGISNLTTLLEDFLSLEKLENGKVASSPQVFNLPELCQELSEEIQVMMQPAQQIHYIQLGTETKVWMDKNLLRNAVLNLLSNAVKYAGEQAFITLETCISANRISVKVIDNGPGIPESHHKNLFTPFYRVNPNTSIPGTGLGLTIVKKYVELMNGIISFSSIPFHATTFELSFPVFSPHKF